MNRKVSAARGRNIFSQVDCQAIAKAYDGSTATVDALVAEWQAKRVGVNRRNIMAAAKRGGYVDRSGRRGWTAEEDAYLEENWHKVSADEIASALGRTFNSVNLRRKRIGIGRYDGDELTIRDLEDLTKLDHRQWHQLIDRGWLAARHRARRNGAAPFTYVSLAALHALLTKHPEVYDYSSASQATRSLLELDKLPAPPKYKRVNCASEAWTDTVKPTPVGRQVTHGAATLSPRSHSFKLASCADEGGISFWAPTYAVPACPRCGCMVSRYSDEALFTNLEPDKEEEIDIQARKLGLRWADGELRDSAGAVVRDLEILQYLFAAGRKSSRSVSTFAKLIDAGLAQVRSEPLGSGALLENILDFELRPDQEEDLQQWVREGSLTAAHAMSYGKSVLGLMVMTRVAGRHLLVVDTQLNREQWVERLQKHAPSVSIRHSTRPTMTTVKVFDRKGFERSTIVIVTYMTRDPLDGPWDVVCCDEVHRLPAAKAHRIALVPSKHRLGLSSTADMRADGRGSLVGKMTGRLVGEDWTEQMRSRVVKKIPVKVILVEDREHKHEVVGQLLRRHERVAVLCEALEDGRELELRYGIPFIHHETRNKLAVIRAVRSVVLSRIGDAGISMPQCEVTIDHSGLFGSRIQSLQRLGRLMHSDRAQYHVVLMTREERYERFGKRIEAIKAKGFDVTESVARRRRAKVHSILTPALKARVLPGQNPLLSALGWRRDELIKAA